MLDLFVGYDERLIAEDSHDLTTFQTPFRALRLVTLPMGWTNSVPIFHDDVSYILQPKIPTWTVPYIDDVPVKGPSTCYETSDGKFDTLPENPGIRRFVWEHFETLNRIIQRMKYCGGTFSGVKLFLCIPQITVLGHVCTYEGRIADETRVAAIRNWGPCSNVSEVRAFLGTIGVCRIFIRNFARRAHALTQLTRKHIPFEFGPDQLAAQEDLKQALISSPTLKPIDYTSSSPVILAVDTSSIAVRYFLCQCDENNPKIRTYNCFESITLNDRETRFSQAKLEIYGLYRALQATQLYLLGVRNLIVEVDTRYIKGMLSNPDISPSASINRWILAILTFQFKLVHVKGENHGPDGLSRRPRQPNDPSADPDDHFNDWIDNMHGFVHMIQPLPQFFGHHPSLLTFAGAQIQNEEEKNTDTVESIDLDTDDYAQVPRSNTANSLDFRLELIRKWLSDLERPSDLSDEEYIKFIRYAMHFFVDDNKLWRKDRQGAHKLVIFPDR